ncbi:flagellar motor protein MotB [Denitrificimonas caeni]|uniref:flagellar motor protein MotB n=1 Tax=Denitrificimonas caeni TaxID=521720 RepID=UPI0003B52C91|nr:flagellar motor protein MotB [Denitrificimonas caeni]
MDNNQPIIVKRVKKIAAGHHGGAWKIAFADFAVAMMAFFLVMWLMSSATPEQKKAISGYFQDPIGFSESASPYVIDLGGTPTPAPDKTLNPELNEQITPGQQPLNELQAEQLYEQLERERLDILLIELQRKINEDVELRPYKEQILMDVSRDGLRIQITDAANRPMFDLGSARLQPYFEDILYLMADTIRAVPNKISVGGHTDAKPYAGNSGFGNWELSSSRANAARRALRAGGLDEEKIARVAGYASSALFDRADPYSPSNRRIDILVLTKRALHAIEGEPEVELAPAEEGASDAESGKATSSKPVREKLNVFEKGVLQFDEVSD